MDEGQLGEAYAARRAGNAAAAVGICRRILADEPDQQGARSLLAVCFAEAGHVEKARPLIEQAAESDPENWRLQLNLSVLREIEGRTDDAIESARKAADLAPDRFEAWGQLGSLYGRRDNFEGAVAALERALDLLPDHSGMALLLAAAAYETGRYELADAALGRYESSAPPTPESLRLRAQLERRRGDWQAFEEVARGWLAVDPASEEARVALAHAQAQREDYHGAVETYRPLAAARPDDPNHAARLAQHLLWSRDFEQAESLYRKALNSRPNHAPALSGLARLKGFEGKFEEAARLARQAIAADPADVDAYAQLALADPGQLSADDLARLGAVAMDPGIPAESRAMAWFTLGDMHHRARDPGPAFDAWQRANDLRQDIAEASVQTRYDPRETERLVDRLIALFDGKQDVPTGEHTGPQPLFIVGMPRSGTTLLEAALAAHRDVASGGELPGMPALLRRFLEWAETSDWQGGAIPPAILDRLRAAYLRQFAQYRIGEAPFITDKQPLNFLSAGLIRRLFPGAPIVHIRRDPLETGFSVYRHNFTRSWPFSTSLEAIGHYYGQYARLMEHWRGILGNRMAHVGYEDLVGEFEGELRRLLAYVGLPWDPDCLIYYKKEGVVTTLSSAQVRQAPTKDLMRSTPPYLSYLEPLRRALEAAGVCLDAR